RAARGDRLQPGRRGRTRDGRQRPVRRGVGPTDARVGRDLPRAAGPPDQRRDRRPRPPRWPDQPPQLGRQRPPRRPVPPSARGRVMRERDVATVLQAASVCLQYPDASVLALLPTVRRAVDELPPGRAPEQLTAFLDTADAT